MQKTMKAAVIHDYGDNSVVKLTDVDRPDPRPGEVLIKVEAAGVNPIDWKIRNGAGERLGLKLPIHMGGELVGRIEQLGDGVHDFRLNDLVFGMVHTGAFAEFAIAKARDLVSVPVKIDIVAAAALPLAGTTAWQALFQEEGLQARQRLLVTNSSGGVGSLAIQFAKAIGAPVTAVASTRNEGFVKSLGADAFIDYTKQSFESIVSDIDVVLDTVGGDTFQKAFRTLKKGGFMVTVVAFPTDEAERYGVNVKRSFTVPSAANLIAIKDLVEKGLVKTSIEAVFPLTEIRDALELSESGRVRGKIVLRVAS